MADASKLKNMRRPGLGTPPPLEEARVDLFPEVPMPPTLAPLPSTSMPVAKDAAAPVPRSGRIDGRALRRSGRTVQFATRVSPEFDQRIRTIAVRDELLLVEVLERALDAYEATKNK